MELNLDRLNGLRFADFQEKPPSTIAMARGLNLEKATNDNGFGQFRNMLSYKMEERGKKLITIDKWFPSSKTCRHCGCVNSDLEINDREWICPSCGAKIDRDVNAAINIKTEGLRNVS